MKYILVLATMSLISLTMFLIILSLLIESIELFIQNRRKFKVVNHGKNIIYVDSRGCVNFYTFDKNYVPPRLRMDVLSPVQEKSEKKQS